MAPLEGERGFGMVLGGTALHRGIEKTRSSFFGRIAALLRRADPLEALGNDLEEALVVADVGVETTERLLADLRSRCRRGELRTPAELETALREELVALLRSPAGAESLVGEGLTLILVVGVNGVGKTTTAAKLAHYWQQRGRRVLLAAADTFRAAGSEQLGIWAERVAAPWVAGQRGADPGAVVFDALAAARARGMDLVLVDTAGRSHTKTNLMEELRKLRRVGERQGVVTETLLVLDASTGQNGIAQARAFRDAVGLAGIAVAKLDGTAKGGVVFSIRRELGAPVVFVGTGQALEDLAELDAEAFVSALFEGVGG